MLLFTVNLSAAVHRDNEY